MIVTDHEYPARAAFTVLSTLLDEFVSKVPQSAYSDPPSITFPDITTYLQKYQDPREADLTVDMGMEAQQLQELDETRLILVSLLMSLMATKYPPVYPR